MAEKVINFKSFKFKFKIHGKPMNIIVTQRYASIADKPSSDTVN